MEIDTIKFHYSFDNISFVLLCYQLFIVKWKNYTYDLKFYGNIETEVLILSDASKKLPYYLSPTIKEYDVSQHSS